MTSTTFRILILEHVHNDAQMIEAQLHKSMMPVQTRFVSSKELFLKAIPDFDPDLIIVDYGVPKFDTLAALKQSQVDLPGVLWIVLSSAGNEDIAVSCMKAGASDYISKKNIARLGLVVRQLIDRKSAAKPQAQAPVAPPTAPSPVPPAAPPAQAAETFFQKLFRLTVETTNDLIAFVDLDGKRIYNNPAYGSILEDPDILKGTDSFHDIHPDDRETVQRVFLESLRTGSGKRIEYRLFDIHGETRYIESQGTVLRDADRKPLALSVIGHDITPRKTAEISLYRLLASTSSKSGDEFFSVLVRDLAKALGVKYALVSEVVGGKNDRVRALGYWILDTWMPRFEYDVTGTTCEKVLMDRKLCYFPDKVHLLFPGEAALSAMNAASYLGMPLISGSGDLLGHIFVMDDKPLADYQTAHTLLSIFGSRAATEIQHLTTLAELRATVASLQSILESLNDGVIMTDLADIITYVNPQLAHLLGYEEGEMVGKTASTLLLPKAEWEALQVRNMERSRGATERYRTQLRRRDGTFVESVLSAGPYRDQHGHIVGTVAIVTADLPPETT